MSKVHQSSSYSGYRSTPRPAPFPACVAADGHVIRAASTREAGDEARRFNAEYR